MFNFTFFVSLPPHVPTDSLFKARRTKSGSYKKLNDSQFFLRGSSRPTLTCSNETDKHGAPKFERCVNQFKAIAAMSLNPVIGAGNKIPWHLPEDFKWFKQKTSGNVIVMDRKSTR